MRKPTAISAAMTTVFALIFCQVGVTAMDAASTQPKPYEIMATAVKRQHEPQRIVGDLLNAEISEKQARSIKYQLTIAKLPLAKDLDDFQFQNTPKKVRADDFKSVARHLQCDEDKGRFEA